MKRFLLVVVSVLLTLSTVNASEESSIALAVDLRAVDALYEATLQAQAELRLSFNDEFALRIPFSLTSDLSYNDIQLWEAGLLLDYYPFKKGFYLSVSLVQIGLFRGFDKPKESILYLNEVAFGYTWHLSKSFYVEPRLIIRDPSGVYEREYTLIHNTFIDRSVFRVAVVCGWEFLAIPSL